jgi:hypothetical protein
MVVAAIVPTWGNTLLKPNRQILANAFPDTPNGEYSMDEEGKSK